MLFFSKLICLYNQQQTLPPNKTKKMFNNGHNFMNMVDGEPRSRRIDRRVAKFHRNCRTNMRNRWGKRSALHAGQVLDGTHYNAHLTCTMCLEIHPRDAFQNRTVQPNIRYNNGMNIRCRYCIDKLKTCGYSVNAFIEEDDNNDADDEEDDEDKEDGDEEEEEEIGDDDEDTEEEEEEGEDQEDKEDQEDTEEDQEDKDDTDDTEEEEEEKEEEENTEEEKEKEEEENTEEEKEDDGTVYYEVEQIIEHKLTPAKSGTFNLLFLIKWKGYSNKHNSWEPYKELRHTTVFQQYNASHKLIDKK